MIGVDNFSVESVLLYKTMINNSAMASRKECSFFIISFFVLVYIKQILKLISINNPELGQTSEEQNMMQYYGTCKH